MNTKKKIFTSKPIHFKAPEDGVLSITNYPDQISMTAGETVAFKVRHTLISKLSKN